MMFKRLVFKYLSGEQNNITFSDPSLVYSVCAFLCWLVASLSTVEMHTSHKRVNNLETCFAMQTDSFSHHRFFKAEVIKMYIIVNGQLSFIN